nr:hypothetical protein Iba_chr01bCG10460 [Ipomoea batatas]
MKYYQFQHILGLAGRDHPCLPCVSENPTGFNHRASIPDWFQLVFLPSSVVDQLIFTQLNTHHISRLALLAYPHLGFQRINLPGGHRVPEEYPGKAKRFVFRTSLSRRIGVLYLISISSEVNILNVLIRWSQRSKASTQTGGSLMVGSTRGRPSFRSRLERNLSYVDTLHSGPEYSSTPMSSIFFTHV